MALHIMKGNQNVVVLLLLLSSREHIPTHYYRESSEPTTYIRITHPKKESHQIYNTPNRKEMILGEGL
jgi:hypothetical protein